MPKIFLIVALIAVLLSNVAFAAQDEFDAEDIVVDWSQAPRIGSRTELFRYVENERRAGNTKICVVLTNGLQIPWDEFMKLAPVPEILFKSFRTEGTDTYAIYILREYPGTNVANAYLRGDLSTLTDDEKKIYDAAIPIVNAAKKISKPLERERYLHDVICARATYFDSPDKLDMPNFLTAAGVFLDGKANCQGYSDAFYMLGRMCGFNVGRVLGYLNGGLHVWNTIEFDGRIYSVDLYDSDTAIAGNKIISYVYFNAPTEISRAEHIYDWHVAPEFQRVVDDRYAYRAFKDMGQFPDADKALKFLAKKISKPGEIFRATAPFDEKFSDDHFDEVAAYLKKKSRHNVDLNIRRVKNLLFFTATAK